MGVIFDTSVLIAIERNNLSIEKFIKGRENELFGVSAVAISELLHSIHRADSEKRRLTQTAYVEKIIELFPIYPFDLSAARIYAQIWANLAKKGVNVGAHDLMIASTAISLAFSVVTCDLRDYGKIKGLTVEKFTS
ncbi:MAG: type II toxin-antitoxin system VapC family toxin [Nitrospirae bacterium]|nr:type II toxin-antitoxin system VapC family toxin [Nitrospirota bacterium]